MAVSPPPLRTAFLPALPRLADTIGTQRIMVDRVALVSAVSAPAAPTLSAAPGNGQVTFSWVDGANNGANITSHKLYGGSNPAALALVGTITSASPYVYTGVANGSPYYAALSAVNSAGEGARSSTASTTPFAPLTITGTPPAATQNSPYSYTPSTSGGYGTKTFALTGTLPAGLSFSTSTGSIAGTPTAQGTATGLNITVTDSSGSKALGAFQIVVGAPAATQSGRFDSTSWTFDSNTFPTFDMAA